MHGEKPKDSRSPTAPAKTRVRPSVQESRLAGSTPGGPPAARVAAQRVTVCLVASHPLLQAEFERLLPAPEFRLVTRRFGEQPLSDLEALSPPPASVYAVEAQANGQVTQSLVGAIGGRTPAARVLVLAEKFREEDAFALLRIGIKGLLTYSEVASQLAQALRAVAAGGFWVPRSLLSRFLDATLEAWRRPRPLPSAGQLSRREREVVELILQNFSNKEIANKLRMSERTAKFHVSNLLVKFSVKRRADLILLSLDPTSRGSREDV